MSHALISGFSGSVFAFLCALCGKIQNAFTRITSIYDGSSTSALLTGMMWSAIHDECPQAEYTGIAMEYGTVPVLETLQALRADQWLGAHPDAPPALAGQIRQEVLRAFYTDTDAWRETIIAQAREALRQAVDGLAGD